MLSSVLSSPTSRAYGFVGARASSDSSVSSFSLDDWTFYNIIRKTNDERNAFAFEAVLCFFCSVFAAAPDTTCGSVYNTKWPSKISDKMSLDALYVSVWPSPVKIRVMELAYLSF